MVTCLPFRTQMMSSSRKRRDRGAQFIRNNLELLGFGNRRDALVQAVKELFENGPTSREEEEEERTVGKINVCFHC